MSETVTTTNGGSEPILKVQNLKKYFQIGGGFLAGKGLTIRAVDDVSFFGQARARRSDSSANPVAARRRLAKP